MEGGEGWKEDDVIEKGRRKVSERWKKEKIDFTTFPS
jgi:hypothetical protein